MAFNRRKSRSSSEGSSRTSKASRGSSKSSGKRGYNRGDKPKYLYVGNVSVTEGTQKEYEKDGQNIIEMLKDSGIRLTVYVTQDVELQKGDFLNVFLQDCTGEYDKDWYVGKLTISND